MAIEIHGKTIRNLQEQVDRNQENVEDLIKRELSVGNLNILGIHVIGKVSTADELPAVGENFGDAYIVGTEEPYSYYVWSGCAPSQWVNIGKIKGPQGPQGPSGNSGFALTIKGVLASTSLLPDPSAVDRHDGYLVKVNNEEFLYGLIDGTSGLEWYNMGRVAFSGDYVTDDELNATVTTINQNISNVENMVNSLTTDVENITNNYATKTYVQSLIVSSINGYY